MKRSRPFKTVRHGNTVLPIHKLKTRTGIVYSVVWNDGSQRKRKAFADPEKASEFATKQAKGLFRLGASIQALSGEEMLAYQRAKALLQPLQVPLDTAVSEYVEARKALGETPLVVAAKEYSLLRPAYSGPVLVDKVIEEFFAAKRQGGRSFRHLKDLSYRLGRFGKSFKCSVSDLKVPDIERWIGSLGVGARSRENYLTAITNLVRFAERRGYLSRGWLNLAQIERAHEEGEVAIFTPEELRALLAKARSDLVPYLAVCAFAGLRSAEAARLDWSEIGEHIDVKAAKAKTRARRLVPILDPLPAWLAPYRKESGPVCPYAKVDHQLGKLAVASEVKWKRNGLRHAFGTYRMALVKNEAQVALEMGNTPAMVFRHYRAVTTEETARAWFAVRPPADQAGTSAPQFPEPSPAASPG